MRFVQAGSYYAGRDARPRLIVLHTTQGPGAPTWAVPTADGIAGYFSRGPGVSSHYVCDEVETVQCVRDEHTAWCAPGANADGLHIEQCGYAEYTEAEWMSGDRLAMLRDQVAPLVARLAAKHGIPLRALTVAEIRAGAAGVCDHNDISEAFPGGGHWDCGGGYPLDTVLNFANGTFSPSAEMSTAVSANRMDLAIIGTDGRVWHQAMDVTKNEGKWSGWSPLGALVTDQPPALVWHRHWLHFFAVERGSGRVMQLSWDNASSAWFAGGAWYPVAGDGVAASGVAVAVGL